MAMTDDGLYEYLQISINQYLVQNKSNQEEVLKSLDSLGYRVGYQLIERHILNNCFKFLL